MRFIGNIIWFIFGGFFIGLSWGILGILLCITVVGIPFGIQCFKMGNLQLAPFGKNVVDSNSSGLTSFVLNILWILFGGLELCLTNLISAFFLSITIVGIPFAKQSLKMAKLSLMPFGKKII